MIRPHRSDPGDEVRPPPDLPGAAARGEGALTGCCSAGAFAAFTVSAGLMHSYAVFLVAFIQAFAWSRAETSIAYSVSQLVAGASSPLVGGMVDRLGPLRLFADRQCPADLRADRLRFM